MQTKEIKQLNITLLFSEPLNHLLIASDRVLNLFKKNEDEKPPRHTLIEGPGLKVFSFSQIQKEVVFEVSRILINDKGGLLPNKSEITNVLEKMVKSEIIDERKIIAYGLNYDVLITPDSGPINFVEFIGSKISKVVKNIERTGIQIAFSDQGNKYNLELKPVDKNKLIAHLNVHYSAPHLPSKVAFKKKLVEQYDYLISLIQKL